MSRPRAEEVDTSLLAAQGAALERRFPLSDFERLRGLLAQGEGEAARTVRARFSFAREEGRAVALVEIDGQLPLVCQRCLGTIEWPVATRSRLAFVEAADAGSVETGDRDNFATRAGLVALGAIVEEELLLALPLVATHADPSACGALASPQPASGAAPVVQEAQRPFAGLRELLGRK
jgi:uncharacterized protein